MERIILSELEKNLIYTYFVLFIIDKKPNSRISKTLMSAIKQCIGRFYILVQDISKGCEKIMKKVSKKSMKEACLMKIKTMLGLLNICFTNTRGNGFIDNELIEYLDNDEEYSTYGFNEIKKKCEIGFKEKRNRSRSIEEISEIEDDFIIPINEINIPLQDDNDERTISILSENSNDINNDEEINIIENFTDSYLRMFCGKEIQVIGIIESYYGISGMCIKVNENENISMIVKGIMERKPIGTRVKLIGKLLGDLSIECTKQEIINGRNLNNIFNNITNNNLQDDIVNQLPIRSSNNEMIDLISKESSAEFSEDFEENFMKDKLNKKGKIYITSKCPICLTDIPLNCQIDISKNSLIHDECEQMVACGRCADEFKNQFETCPLCKGDIYTMNLSPFELFYVNKPINTIGINKKWKTKKKELYQTSNDSLTLWKIYDYCMNNNNKILKSLLCNECKHIYPLCVELNQIFNGVFCKGYCGEFICEECMKIKTIRNNIQSPQIQTKYCSKCSSRLLSSYSMLTNYDKLKISENSLIIDWEPILKEKHFNFIIRRNLNEEPLRMIGKKKSRKNKRIFEIKKI